MRPLAGTQLPRIRRFQTPSKGDWLLLGATTLLFSVLWAFILFAQNLGSCKDISDYIHLSTASILLGLAYANFFVAAVYLGSMLLQALAAKKFEMRSRLQEVQFGVANLVVHFLAVALVAAAGAWPHSWAWYGGLFPLFCK